MKRFRTVWFTIVVVGLVTSTIGCDESEPERDPVADTTNDNNRFDTGTINEDANIPDQKLSSDGSTDGIGQTPDASNDQNISVIGSAGCDSGQGLPEGENTITLENLNRRFIVRLPSGYTNARPWPLVFALHGNGGSAAYWDGTSGDRNIRGELQDDAILIVAEAIGGNWRDYGQDPSTWPARIESELAYFDTLIEMAKTEMCINEDAIFSMGFSGGGSFSGVLGCRRTDIRAIAVGGSVIYFDPQNCVGTPAAWITIGELELAPGREAYRDFFRERASCDATATATEPSPCAAYDNCGSTTPVHYCEHPGDHIWPDFGSAAMWQFFKSQTP